MQQMTPQQALEILDAIRRNAPMPFEAHAQAQQAVDTLRPLVEAYAKAQEQRKPPE